MGDGEARYVTAVSRSDVAAGWRERRHAGGCLVDVASGEIVLGELSMPHSPRLYREALYLLNSGTGELGRADLAGERFEPIAFCPGFLRGLAFLGDYAVVGLSKPRDERTFSGLALDERLREKDAEARCGLYVVDLRSGVVAHWLTLEGVVSELYDVQVLPGVRRPMALGFKSDEIQRLITLDAGAAARSSSPSSRRRRRRAARRPRRRRRAQRASRVQLGVPPRRPARGRAAWCARDASRRRSPPTARRSPTSRATRRRSSTSGRCSRASGARTRRSLATQRALEADPSSPQAHANLASLLQGRGDLAGAIRALEAARGLRPGNAELANQLGLVLYEDGRVPAAKACFEEAVAARPDFAEAYNNLAAVLKLEERLAEALPLHEKAAALRPDFFEALENIGKIHEDLCDVPAARAAYSRALAVRPGAVLELHRELLCPPVFASREAIAEYRARAEAALDARAGSDLRIDLERLQSSRAEPPIEWAYQGPPSRALKEKHAALFDAYLPSRALEQRPSPDGPWKVGFVVTPGHEGVFARCMSGILNRIDLERFRVAVVCSRARAGAIAAAVRRPGIRWIQLPLRFDHVAERLRAAAFDVLYYWEVGTDSSNHFLPFLRLAPVQCTGWGWPDTSCAPELDYHLTSEALAPPGAEAHFSEQLVRLPDLPPCFLRPPIPERPHPPSHFGLPGDAHLYVCAQNLRKMHPDLDTLVGGILREDRRGVAVFVEDTHPAAGALLRARWRETLPDVQDRIVLVPRLGPEDYFHLLAGAHVALDPLHFGGVEHQLRPLRGRSAGGDAAGRAAAQPLHRGAVPPGRRRRVRRGHAGSVHRAGRDARHRSGRPLRARRPHPRRRAADLRVRRRRLAARALLR